MNDVPRIETLSTSLANQIAAGEVVERPASVVKELLENAIDAGASKIQLDLKRAGVGLIKVSDNGHGVHPDDLSLAISSHSTSKIHSSEELLSINTLGFRGEALASIASVSRFKISSCDNESGQGRSLLKLPDGEAALEPAAHNRGTTVEVADLFYNVPARRKFLRTEHTEYLHILSLLKATALAQFDCTFQLKHNERNTLNLPASGQDFSKRISAICGKSFLQHSIALDVSHDGMRVWGWLGKPDAARSQSDRQYLFLNGRLIKDKHINHAIRMAFQEHLYAGRFPSYVLYLQLEPTEVDVNVHPSKQEVRFRRHRDIHDFIYSCLKQSLSRNESVRSLAINVDAYPQATDIATAVHNAGEPVVNYKTEKTVSFSNKTSVANTNKRMKVFNTNGHRHIICELEDNYFLFDSKAIREDLVSSFLRNQLKDKKIISRPLLFPVDMQANENQISTLENRHSLLTDLGIVFRQIAPDRIMILELPGICSYVDAKSLLLDVIELFTDKAKSNISEQELIELIASHANDTVPPEPDPDEQQSLLEYCYQQLKSNNRSGEKGKWRLLNEDDLGKLLL